MIESGIFYYNFKSSVPKVMKMLQEVEHIMNLENKMTVLYIKTLIKTMDTLLDNCIIFIYPKIRNTFKTKTVEWLHDIHEKLANECQNTEKCIVLTNLACLIKYISSDRMERVETMYRKGTYYEETIESK
tara:strand:+ start:1159 stop:1548 length:390 start_codon:yes stop_codon:yes gene_type:complete